MAMKMIMLTYAAIGVMGILNVMPTIVKIMIMAMMMIMMTTTSQN
jgi:hypothetical protein